MPFIVSASSNHSPSPAYIRISDQSVDETDYLLYINLVRSGEIISSFYLSAGGYTDVVLEGLWGDVVQIHVSALGELRPVDAGYWDVTFPATASISGSGSNGLLFDTSTINQRLSTNDGVLMESEGNTFVTFYFATPYLIKTINDPANLYLNVSASVLLTYGWSYYGDGTPQFGIGIRNHSSSSFSPTDNSYYGAWVMRFNSSIGAPASYLVSANQLSYQGISFNTPSENVPLLINYIISTGPHKGSGLYDLYFTINSEGFYSQVSAVYRDVYFGNGVDITFAGIGYTTLRRGLDYSPLLYYNLWYDQTHPEHFIITSALISGDGIS